MASIEETCRKLLAVAVADGLVPNPVRSVESLSAGELVGMANLLNEFLLLETTQKTTGDDVKKIIVDCNASPFVPQGLKEVEHKKLGHVEWDKEKFSNPGLLYLCDEQKVGTIKGHELRKKLEGKKTMNACVLDFLLAHPELIPEHWKGKFVFFWGTIYSASDGGLYVRFLFWDCDEWGWDSFWLVYGWNDDCPALLAS